MIALDTNVLIGLAVSSSSLYGPTTEKMQRLDEEFCTTPTNIAEFLRLLTHPKVFSMPLKIGKAVDVLHDLMEHYQIRLLDEDIDWWKNLPSIAVEIPGLKGNEIFNARIALCLKSHDVKKIFTFDSDFKKYSFLKTI